MPAILQHLGFRTARVMELPECVDRGHVSV